MEEKDWSQILADFSATRQAKPNLTEAEWLQKFPEFGNSHDMLQAAFDYDATVRSGKYTDTTELQSKFPEFWPIRVDVSDVQQAEQTNQPVAETAQIPTVTMEQVESAGHYQPRSGEGLKTPEELEAEVQQTEPYREKPQTLTHPEVPVDTEISDESIRESRERLGLSNDWGAAPFGRDKDGNPIQWNPQGKQNIVQYDEEGHPTYDFSPESVAEMNNLGKYIAYQTQQMAPDIAEAARRKATEPNYQVPAELKARIDEINRASKFFDEYERAYKQSPFYEINEQIALKESNEALAELRGRQVASWTGAFAKTVGAGITLQGSQELAPSPLDYVFGKKFHDDMQRQSEEMRQQGEEQLGKASLLMMTVQELEQAKNTIRLSQRNQDGAGTYTRQLWNGLVYSNLTGLDQISSMSGALGLVNIAEKLDENGQPKEPLTEEEQLAYDALVFNSAVQQRFGKNVTMFNRIGQSIPENTAYVLDFTLGSHMGAGAIGKGASNMTKKAIGGMVKREVRNGALRFTLDKALPTMANIAAQSTYRNMLDMPFIYSDAMNRQIGQMAVDPETMQVYGFVNGKDEGQAWGEAWGARGLSNASESFGDLIFEPGVGMVWRNVKDTKGGLKLQQVRKWFGDLGNGKVDDALQYVRKFNEQHGTGWQSFPIETAEEFSEGTLNALFIGDQELKEVYSSENMMETALNCFVFGVAQASTITGLRRGFVDLPNDIRLRSAKREAAAVINDMDNISVDDIEQHINEDKGNALADWLYSMNNDGNWNEQQRRAVMDYTRATIMQKARNQMRQTQMREDIEKSDAEVDASVNNVSGNVILATFELDGQTVQGTVIKGRVSTLEEPTDDGNGNVSVSYRYNPHLSSATLGVRLKDGTVKVIGSKAITSIDAIEDPNELKEQWRNNIVNEVEQEITKATATPSISQLMGNFDFTQPGGTLSIKGQPYRFDGRDENGNYTFTPLDGKGIADEGRKTTISEKSMRTMALLERLNAAFATNASDEEVDEIIEELNTDQTLDNIERSKDEANVWAELSQFLGKYVALTDEGDFDPEKSDVAGAAGYLVSLKQGDVNAAAAIVDERINELNTRLAERPEGMVNNGEGVVGMAVDDNAAEGMAKQTAQAVAFLQDVRQAIGEMQQDKVARDAEKHVSELQKGDIFPVEMDGQRYWAQLDGHTVDGPVVSLYDNERAEGEPVDAAIDDMTDEQWDALRVNPQAPSQEGEQQPQEEISGKDGNISPVSPESPVEETPVQPAPVEEKTRLEKDTETIMSRPNGAKLLDNKIKASEKSLADAQQALGDATTAYENAKKANEEGSSASDEEMFDQETKALQEAEDAAREALDNAVAGMQSAQAEVDRWNAVRDAIEGNKSETPPAPTQEGEVPEQPVDEAPVEETPPPAAPTQEGEETSPNPSLEEGKEQSVEETPVEETPVEEAQLNPVQMSDDELLNWMERDGHGDVNKAYHTDVYDEYDSRHNDDFLRFYDEAVEEISRIEAQLEDGNSEKNDGLIQLISDIYTKADEEWDNGGSYSEQRTKLSARLAAAEEWLDKNVRGEGEPGPTDGAVAAANEEVDTNPTEAQKEAGNYKKGHVTIDGFDISIENPAGSTRSGTDAQGNPWSVTMHNSYGYIRMTEGVDGDHIDIFLSDHIDDWNGTVYVVDQVKEDGSFDEHKVMYGFNSAEEAREAYLSNYSEGWQGLGTITGVSREEFKKWVDSSHRKTKAFADYKSVQTTEGQNEAMNTQPTEQPEKPKKEKKESEFQKRITAVGEPRTLEEAILYDIAVGGAKFRWGNRNEDKAVVKRGIGDLWKYSNSEYKKRIGIVKKDGYSIETYAEAILAGQLQPYSGAVSQIAEQMDMHDIIGTIEDVLQMVTSRSGALQAIEEKRLAEAEEEENYIRSLKDAYAQERGFKDFDEMEEYYTERVGEGKDLTDDEYYEISRIFAEQYGDSVIEKEDGQESREGLDRPADSETGTNEQSGVRGEGEGGNSLLQSQQTPSDEGREQPGQETGGLQGNPHDGTAQEPSGAAEVRDEIDKLKAKRADIIRQRDDIQQRYEKANGLFGDTQADESDLFGGQNFLSPELAQATIDGYNRQIRQIDDRIAKLEASLKRAGEVKQTEIGTPAMESPENRTEQGGQKPTETREELDRRLMEERKQRILTEGTSYDKPFGLVPVSETMTVEDIDTNMQRIAEGLKANEGNKDFGNFYGFAYQGNFKENLGQQLKGYYQSLTGVVDPKTLMAWAGSHGFKTYDDVVEYGKGLYDKIDKTEKADKETDEEPKKETKKQANTPSKAGPAKIDDVGEKIGGARKDLAQQMSGKIKLDADTFPKMFPKFDLKKLVEQGLDPKMAAAVMFLRQAAYAEYKQKNKRQSKSNALAAAKFFAAYAKQVLEKGDTDVEFTDSGWVFTDYGKIHMKANIALYGKIHDKMGNDMFDVDLTGYEIFPVNVDSKSTYTAYRKNEKGENVPFKPRYVTRTKSRTSYFKEDELDQAIDEVVSMVEQGVSYDKSHPYKLGVYYTRGKDNSFYVGVKIGNEVKALTEPGGLDATRAYLNEHEAELQAEAARVEQQTKEDKKKERPVAKVEIIKSDRSQGALYGYVFAVKIGKEYVNIMDDTFDLRTIYKYEKEHHDELQEKAQQMLDQYLEEKESGKGWKPQLNLGGGRARVGEDYRKGRDIGADEFRDTFGFRGVEFGNYVTQKERQRYLNEAYDAFMDLADLLGVSPRALSLGGQLGFAIGARGGGGKNAAHYEPELNVINLTKTQGAGSVAHEWWHALDFYFNQRNGERKRPATGNTVAESFDASVRREMAEAFVGLMEKVNDSEYFRRSKRLDNKTNRQYFATDTELGARAFQDYVQRRLTERGQVNDFLSSFTPEEQWNGEETTYPYPTGEEANAIDERFDNLFSTMEERKDESGNTILFSVTSQTEALAHQYQQKLDEIDRRMAEADNSFVRNALRATREGYIWKYLERIKDAGREVVVYNNDNLVPMLKGLNVHEADIREVERLRASGRTIEGFCLGNAVYINADAMTDIDLTRSKFVHERQHAITRQKENSVYLQAVLQNATRKELQEAVDKMSGARGAYNSKPNDILADEFISFAMERAYSAQTDAELEEALGAFGINRDLIEIIKLINHEQRNNESLSTARKPASVGRRSDAGGNRQDGRDTQARPGGDLGQEGSVAAEQGAGGTEGRQGVAQTPRNSSINDVLYSITVNHNSPHLIKKADGTFVDPETGERLGFDHRFMSTGEGIQAHGWGSYFSVEDLRHYADDLNNPNTPPMRAAMRQQGRRWLEENPTFEAWKETKEFKDYYYNHEDSAFKYIEELKTRGPEWQADIEDIEKRIEERRRQREDEDYLRKQYGIEREAALTQSSRHHYDVEIPDDNGTNYFEENEPMKPEQIAMLQAQSDKEGAKAEVGGFLFYANPEKNPYADRYTFRKFLTDITSDMGGGLNAQQASEFFHRAGFTGIHYYGSRDGEGYVIFDENDAKIMDHVRFSVTNNNQEIFNTEAKEMAYNAVREALANAGIEVEVATEEEVERLKAEMKTLQDSKGVVRGWVGNDGRIYLTSDGMSAETPIHEYTHLWAEALQMNNPELWEQIKGLLKGTPEWQRITSMKEYSNLKDDDRIAGEVLAHISGKKNAERMEAEAKRMIDEAPTLEEAAKAANLLGRMRDALKKFWTWVGKSLLGRKGNINIDQVSNMVLADLTNGIDPFHPRGGKRTNRTKRTEASIEDVNERFNEELEGLTDENADGRILMLGNPSKVLLSAGISNKPLKLYGSKLKAKARKHGFSYEELKDLPNAVASPIAVFEGSVEGSHAILTEMKLGGNNVLVSISLGRDNDVDFNIVSSVYGKNGKGVLGWINSGKMLYADKEKALDYLRTSAPIADASSNQELDSAAKIVENFENPQVEGENFSDADLSIDVPDSGRMAVRDEFDELSGAHPAEKANTIRQKYEQLLTDQVNKFRPLKQLEGILSEKKGRKLRDSESFYSRATMTAARTLPQMEAEREIYLLPLEQAVNEVFGILDPDGKRAGRRTRQEEGGRENETMKQLRQRMADYLIAKHGLERNKWFHQQALAKDPNAQEEDKSGLRGLAESLGENPDDYKAVAERVVAEFEHEVGQQGIDNLWKELNGFTNRLLEMSYNDGFTDKDHYEELKGRWKHYVPLRGFAEGTSDDMYYYTTQGGDSAVTMMKAKGRTSKADDPLTHLVKMQEKAVTAGNDNWAKTALYNAAINLPSDLLRVKQVWYTEDPNTGEIIEHYADLTGLTSPDDIDAAIKQFNADMKAAGAKRRLNKADVGKRIRPQNIGEHEIEVWVNGKKFVIEVNGNPSLVRAYSESQDELKGFIKGVQKANRLEARLFTTWNPEFAVKNMMRDTNFALFSAFVIGGTKQWNETRKNIHTARLVLPKLMKDGTVSQTLVKDAADRQKLEQWYREFIENGGETGFTRTMNAEQVSRDINDTLRALAKGNEDGVTKMEKLAGAIEDLNRWAENSTRFAAYITARERGETVTKAMDAAKNSTLNFNIKGYEGKRLRAWFCFFNARLQGVAQLARLAKENPKRFAIGLGAAVLTGAMVPFLNILLLGLGGDDDDWKTYEYMSEYTGNNNLVLFIPGIHKFVAIPYSQELAPFSAIGNIWFREAMGWNRNKSAWQQEMEMGLAYLPMEINLSDKEGTWPMLGSTVARSVAPTIMQPIVEYAVNENFMNMPLRKDSKYKSELAAWTQAYENRTSGALIKASKWLNGGGSENRWGKAEVLIDPSFIQHVVEGTAGGVGSFIGNARDLFTEPDWFNHLPFVRKFMFDGDPKKWQGGLDRAYSAYAYDFIDERDRRIDAIRYDNQSTLDYARQMWAEHNSTDKAIYDLAKDYRDNLGKYKEKVNGHWVNMSSFGENPYRYKDNGRDLLPIIGLKGMRQYYNDLRANDAEQELIDEWRGKISEYEMQMVEEIEAVYYRDHIQGKKPISEGLRKMVDEARGREE